MPETPTPEDALDCPPCKLLLNSGGLNGALRGALAVKDHLNARGKDWRPELYEKLNAIICGAHEALVALEPELGRGPFVDLTKP
jgi:hypothetical protein